MVKLEGGGECDLECVLVMGVCDGGALKSLGGAWWGSVSSQAPGWCMGESTGRVESGRCRVESVDGVAAGRG